MAVRGHMLCLHAYWRSIRIYWFNQTGILEITTAKNDAVMIAKYAETVIRRTFNTDSAMKKYNDKIEVEELT